MKKINTSIAVTFLFIGFGGIAFDPALTIVAVLAMLAYATLLYTLRGNQHDL